MSRVNLLKNTVCGMLVAGAIGIFGISPARAADIPYNRWTNQQLSTRNKMLQRDARDWRQARDEFKERHAPYRGGPRPRPEYQGERNKLLRQRDHIRNRMVPIQNELRRRNLPTSRATPSPSRGFSGQRLLNGRRLF